jgi:(2Fe-2S) ferredoxin
MEIALLPQNINISRIRGLVYRLSMMKSPKYRVFVCTRQRSSEDSGGCCYDAGAMDIYRAFQSEIAERQLGNRIEIRQSGCLNHCEAGAVALVYRSNRRGFSWLPTKLRLKLRRMLFPNRHLYGHLTCEDISAIVDSHFIDGQPLERCQIDLSNK